MLEPLRIRDFALLWSGMTVSLVGDAMFVVALAWQTYDLSSSPESLGGIVAAYTAPTVIFLLVGGVLTDRFERRLMMICADVIRAAALCAAGFLALTSELQLWQFGIFVALAGTGAALFRPAFDSIVPEIVPPELLPQANSLDQFVRPLAGLVGPAVAGLVIAVSDAGVVLVLDACTFVASAVTALALTARPIARSEHRSVLRELREGLSFVRRRAWLWGTLVTAALMNVAAAARTVLLPFVLRNDIGGSATGLGLVYSAAAAGAIVSSFAYGQRGLPRRHVLAMYAGWATALFAIGAYGLARGVPQLVAFAFVGGLGVALGQAIWGTMMQRLVPRAVLGRVSSIDWMVSLSLIPVSTVAMGFLAAAIGARATLALAGAFGGLVTLGFLVALPGLRDSERDESMSSLPLREPAGQGAQP
jgi:DHA3 family tetracycline resistance protein-like MFS transporter